LNVKLTALLTANDTDMLVMKLQCKDRFSALAVASQKMRFRFLRASAKRHKAAIQTGLKLQA